MPADKATACRLCGSESISECFSFRDHHIVHHLIGKKDEVSGYTGDFVIKFCESCGFLFSPTYFAPKELIYKDYITLSGQKKQSHAIRLVRGLETFGICKSSSFFEIGCNDGTFLDLLKAGGYTDLSAIEPARDAYDRASESHSSISNDYFTLRFAEDHIGKERFDVVVTRQVLEHIEDLDDFLKGIRVILRPNGLLAIEVPDHTMSYTYLDYSFWEEHINYFTLSTLKKLLEKHGFRMIYHESLMFSGQAITVYCKRFKEKRDFIGLGDEEASVRRKYIGSFQILKRKMREYLAHKCIEHNGLYVYGAGCRSLCLIDWLELNDLVTAFVDDSRYKVGKYTANGIHKIMSSVEVPTDAFFLLGVNCEIEEQIISRMRFSPNQYASLLPPSKYLPDFWLELI